MRLVDTGVQILRALGQLGQLGRDMPAREMLTGLAEASVQISWVQSTLPPSPLTGPGPETIPQ